MSICYLKDQMGFFVNSLVFHFVRIRYKDHFQFHLYIHDGLSLETGETTGLDQQKCPGSSNSQLPDPIHPNISKVELILQQNSAVSF